MSEPIYQIEYPTASRLTWADVDKAIWDNTMVHRRRVVYAAPAEIKESPQPKRCISCGGFGVHFDSCEGLHL